MFFSFPTITAFQAVFIAGSLAIPSAENPNPFKSTAGFLNPTFSTSSGGFANCLSGHISLTATTNSNEKLLFTEPINQYSVTASFVHFLQANSSQAAEINGGSATISDTFKIAAKLCYPKNWSGSTSTVQFLTHGIGFNQSYVRLFFAPICCFFLWGDSQELSSILIIFVCLGSYAPGSLNSFISLSQLQC